ncbi:MAG: long-chain fatty acid--CoA ligase [Acidobacteriaceae bacterium]|jgi:long-chain acyl-CoA synthetase
MQDVRTINDAFLKMSGRGDEVVWRWLDASAGVDGTWKPIASAEAYGRVRALAARLAQWGVVKGDRVALISENRWEWPVTDFAVLALGAVDVPLYMTLTAEQVGYMLRDSGAKVAVVSSWEQVEKVRAAGVLPGLEHVLVMDEMEPEQATVSSPTHRDEAVMNGAPGVFAVQSFAELMKDSVAMQERDAEFDALARLVQPDDLATIIYTSGTTGEPKGVMLTHGNLASNFTMSTRPFGFTEQDSCVSFLPLSHVTARHLDYAMMDQRVTLAYCPKFDRIATAMKQVRPTLLVAVPRVYEKIRQAVEGKSHGARKMVLNWALSVGRKHRAQTLAGKQPGGLGWKLADKLVFSKIRAAFGGRVRFFVSGGAPLGMDTAGWFADVGIRILEGYGLTETSPLIAVNDPQSYRIGSVGPVLPNVEARFAADGELEVRGPSVFHGYWNKPEETAAAFTPDGWLRTGDIGMIDADGFLSITDRKKEMLKTSGGKMIAPQPIENKLKARMLVANAALVGDKHKFACALISPNFAILESWARVKGVVYPAGDRKALVAVPQVVARYQRIVNEVNATLAPYQTIKRIAVVPDEWTVEGDELTPSMKLKRRVVEQKYAAEIAEFYQDEATSSR